jgi:quinol monooxygenase YgiN
MAVARGDDHVAVRRDLTSAGREVEGPAGFMYHVAFVDDGVFTVSEIWESQEKHDRWFDANVAPNVPGIEQQVVEVHAVHTP